LINSIIEIKTEKAIVIKRKIRLSTCKELMKNISIKTNILDKFDAISRRNIYSDLRDL